MSDCGAVCRLSQKSASGHWSSFTISNNSVIQRTKYVGMRAQYTVTSRAAVKVQFDRPEYDAKSVNEMAEIILQLRISASAYTHVLQPLETSVYADGYGDCACPSISLIDLATNTITQFIARAEDTDLSYLSDTDMFEFPFGLHYKLSYKDKKLKPRKKRRNKQECNVPKKHTSPKKAFFAFYEQCVLQYSELS